MAIDTLETLPLVGLGTWELVGKECSKVVSTALDLGYRHIDTALAYQNHKAIGTAIKAVKRSELFITSKFSLENLDFKQLDSSLERLCVKAIDELGCGYLDLFLIHTPDHELAMHKVIFSLEKLRDKGLIYHLGVSNFTIRHMKNLLAHQAYFSCNQVEFHPYFFQKELLDFCSSNHIKLISYRPFGKGKILSDPYLHVLGKKHGKSPSQIILRWLTQRNIPVIPKASSFEHLKENISIFDFSLTQEQIFKIDALDRNIRFCMSNFSEFSY